MVDRIEDIGPLLGIVAFVGLAVLVFLLIQQAREVRRLREWAGRAPERAILIAEREAAERGAEESSWLDGVRAWGSRTYATIDRVSPVDPRFGLAFVGVVLVALLALVGPFGLLGGDSEQGKVEIEQGIDPATIRVSVLNGTATATSPAVPELASRIAKKVRKQGYKLGEVTDAPSTPKSVAMYRDGREQAATQVASELRSLLGAVRAERMTDAVGDQAGGADVALIIGIDDSRL